jgi:hypothetical protein
VNGLQHYDWSFADFRNLDFLCRQLPLPIFVALLAAQVQMQLVLHLLALAAIFVSASGRACNNSPELCDVS